MKSRCIALAILAVVFIFFLSGCGTTAQPEAETFVVYCADDEYETKVYTGEIAQVDTENAKFGYLTTAGKLTIFESTGVLPTPVALPPLKQFAMSDKHVVGLDYDGRVHGFWITTADSITNALDFNAPLPPIQAVDAGGGKTVLLSVDGAVYSFGKDNHSEQWLVPKMPEITEISCNAYVTTALAKDGTLYVWGVLDDDRADRYNDVRFAVPSDYNVVYIDTAGEIHGDMMKMDNNNFFERPADMRAVKLFAGGQTLAAIDAEGKLYVWGNYASYYPNGTTLDIPADLPAIADVALGSDAILCLDTAGKLHFWGTSSSEWISGFSDIISLRFKGIIQPHFKPNITSGQPVMEVWDSEALVDALRAETCKEIVIMSDLTIKQEAYLEIDRAMTIPKGVVVTVAANVSIGGKLVNNGTIIIAGGGQLLIAEADNPPFGEILVEEGGEFSHVVRDNPAPIG